MSAGSRHVTRAGVAVFFITLAIPTTALAAGGGKCNASACKVYVEPNGPSAGKQQSPPPQQQQQPTGGPAEGKGATHVPKNLARALSQAGRDRGPLKNLVTDGGPGSLKGGASAGSPTLLGAAFDLGAGPLVLLSLLLATAFGLAARGSLRTWLQRRSSD
jgi:hypothetical protein